MASKELKRRDTDHYSSDDFEEEDEEEVLSRSPKRKAASPSRKKGWKDIKLADLEIGDQIAGGGFAIVYSGRWQGKKVALKTLFDPDFAAVKEEYMDELLVMSRLRHPNIVRLLGACVKPPKLFFVMELCGMSLFQLLHLTTEEVSVKKGVGFAIDVASALDYLHTRNPMIIHRDIKSLNCLMHNGNQSIKVCDFGLVSTRKKEAGTAMYMAPELLRTVSTFSKAVDVFAFGVLFNEILARKIPFEGLDAESMTKKILAAERPDMSVGGCPDVCAETVKQCWHNNPRRRPSMADTVDVLTACRASLPDSSSVSMLTMETTDALDMLCLKK